MADFGKEVKIACPKCDWEPSPHSRWLCTPCGHIWNTFDTAGRCPSCEKQWKYTQCLSCLAKSPHLDWYRGLDDWLDEELERTLKPQETTADEG